MYGYDINDDGEIVGQMPDGTIATFGSVDEYEDCFYDASFEFNNYFSLELPEIA